jgi:hypothetical protein
MYDKIKKKSTASKREIEASEDDDPNKGILDDFNALRQSILQRYQPELKSQASSPDLIPDIVKQQRARENHAQEDRR